MPVREIPKNHISVTGRHATSKSIGHADFESPLENDYLILLDFDPRVKSYEVQPVIVPVPGVRQGYVPDVLVHFHDDTDGSPVASQLTEIKSDDDLRVNRKKYAPKFAAATSFAEERGWVFVVKSDKEIRTPRLANLKFLRGYRWTACDPSDIEILLAALRAQGGKSRSDRLLDAVSADDETRLRLLPVLWHLVVTSRILVNFDRPFHADVPVWLPGGDA
ncbi:TnsA endonuclease N-terminal domain-containing protein [Thiomonas sp.]|uniref:TnsA endonuclease N-terminal domain-containing protein n=1 Tax=Thiomonas sp. TaxID=2047785 RepID=UPI00258EEE0B|nr:TnsA endonuclease N-terminal domain-containing protein [Thiomonas sp.]